MAPALPVAARQAGVALSDSRHPLAPSHARLLLVALHGGMQLLARHGLVRQLRVALYPGQDVGEDALTAHVATQLASYKKPQRVIFAAEIPKTAVGKLNRRQVRTQFS